jgi:hypothetical protein
MSLANQTIANTPLLLLAPLSAAATANATSAWTQISGYEGIVAVHVHVGVITGPLDITFNTNDAASDSGADAIVPLGGALAQITTSNDVAVYVANFDSRVLQGYLKVIGTIVTGPAIVGYTLVGRKKTV